MLQAGFITENKERVISALKKKNFKEMNLIDEVIALDTLRKKIQYQADTTLAEINRISKEVGKLYSQGRREEAETLKHRPAELKETVKKLNEELSKTEQALREKLLLIPNLPHESVPPGTGSEQNEKVAEGGPMPQLPDNAAPHWELMSKYDLIDIEAGTKITGAGFPLYTRRGARLQRALIQFFLDEAIQAGYEEVIPPFLVNEDSAFGTGQLPDKEGQMYETRLDKLYLIPTAEVPVTNIFRDMILEEKDLPVKRVAYSPCFRREAGSYGKDVRGLNRVHQFDKVEIVQIQKPELSYQTLEEMVQYACSLLQKLQLPYRVMKLCGGDMSFASALTYDLEVYSAAQKRWLEVSSVSNFETFQSYRMKLRYRGADNKPHLAHTLNGSALALPRIVAALLENNQTAEGILIPEVLHEYTGFNKIT
ncbi:MAG: serine--tRNA ligase [Chitinophagales bacterium]|nr:MAG: serine--tRNA ligase [Chitinophagales bacterium]